MQMLLNLMEERQKWLPKRDEAIREISRLSELIRATINMIPPEQLARYEPIFERIEHRPVGLAVAIRACFTTGESVFSPITRSTWVPTKPVVGLVGQKPDVGLQGSDADGWLTPVEIRDALKRMGYPFENYKANPLASIHTTLKRMAPGELEVKKRKDGQKVYRLKGAGEWQQAFAEIRQWLKDDFHVIKSPAAGVIVVKRPQGKNPSTTGEKPGGESGGENDDDRS
jgi:hypothetical protein